jgi:hypothetical protein
MIGSVGNLQISSVAQARVQNALENGHLILIPSSMVTVNG